MTLQNLEARRRELASAVRRLRVAATSDPERTDELADALSELTAHRLLAWDFAEAATDAPESVVLAARLLASRGPSGPYASVPDAVRYFSATAQLAAVQAGLGQADAAGRTLQDLDAWRRQVARLPLAEHLPDSVVVWFLLARSRALLAVDVALANAHADAAALRLHAEPDRPAYLALAVHLLVADCRWAAGLLESALAHHRMALAAHAEVVGGLGRQPRPAVAKIALAPVASLFEPYAARLAASGQATSGIAVRRTEVALWEALAGGAGSAVARAGLADALDAVGRADEASGERAGAEAVPPPAAGAAPAPGQRIGWVALPAAEVLAVAEPSAQARGRWEQAEQAAVFAGAAERARAERDEAGLRERAEAAVAARAAERAAAHRRAQAEAAAALAAREAAAREASERTAQRLQQEEAAARAAAEERRRLLSEAHRRDVDPDAAHRAAADLERARDAVRTAAGDLAAEVAAHEALARVLRPLAAADPAHTEELVATLEELVGLRWRLGDTDGSRAAAREAKGLGS